MSRRVALITGAGSGVGRAAALALAGDGWTAVAAGRRPGPLADAVELIEQAGGSAAAVPADVADPESVDRLFECIRADFGRIDLLFNNAGAAPTPVAFEQISLEDWRRVVDVNLTGSFLCARRAVAYMASLPPDANVLSMTVMAGGMPFVGRG